MGLLSAPDLSAYFFFYECTVASLIAACNVSEVNARDAKRLSGGGMKIVRGNRWPCGLTFALFLGWWIGAVPVSFLPFAIVQ